MAPSPGVDGWRVVKGQWRQVPFEQEVRNDFTVSAGCFAMLCPIGVGNDEVDICSTTAEITIDSAAEESVCPLHCAEHFQLKPVESGKELRFVNASGGRISHWGSRRVAMHAAENGKTLEMGFQVTDVKKALLAVSRLCEKGNIVQFGPEPQHNYIQNVTTGERLHMKRRGNSWVLPGELADAECF